MNHFRGLYCLHYCHDDGGSTDLSNVGKLVPVYRRYNPEDSHLLTGKIMEESTVV
jgi:hypothetical protein